MNSAGQDVTSDSTGSRLRAHRQRRQLSLEEVAEAIGTSASTLSRLESGKRRVTVELLIALARVYSTTLDELATGESLGDPRLHPRPIAHGSMNVLPLSRRDSGVNAFKVLLHPGRSENEPEHRRHGGWQWLVVLEGQLRVMVREREIVLGPGDAAEFDTHLPHRVVPAGERPVEYLVLFGAQGERVSLKLSGQ